MIDSFQPPRLRKSEATHIQGVCVVCRKNKQAMRGKGNYRPVCKACHNKRRGGASLRDSTESARRAYRPFVGSCCEKCGFKGHPCQLDVDHIDGDRTNNDPSNFQTLCANCHRLKTFLAEDWRGSV